MITRDDTAALEILEGAHERVCNGWCRGPYKPGRSLRQPLAHERVCPVTAIRREAHRVAFERSGPWGDFSGMRGDFHIETVLVHQLLDYLTAQVGRDVWMWNDARRRSKRQVVELLRDTIAVFKAEIARDTERALKEAVDSAFADEPLVEAVL